MMHRIHLCVLVLLAATLSWPAAAVDNDNLFPVRVQLKWYHQFQFAGYYTALEKGFFREAGLDVTLIEGGPQIVPADQVLSGAAEFGVGTSALLIARSQGQPIVAVAAVFQHSPYILVTRDDPGIRTPRDLEGKSIMVEPNAEELFAYLSHIGVNLAAVKMVEHTGSPLDIFEGDFVGATAYTSNEPYILEKAGEPYRIFDPKQVGIDFYGDTLFTTEAFAEKHNDRVVAFRDALIRGWRYALQNREEIIDLIKNNYQIRADEDRLRFESDDIRRLLIPDLIEIGYMNPERWRQIAGDFRAAGLMAGDVDIEDFIFKPDITSGWVWVAYILLISIAVILVISVILAKFYALNRSLKAEIAKRSALETELKQLAITDHGTGVLNRRGFLEAAQREIDRANRHSSPISLLELDLDHFKQINDNYGHAAGDRALSMVADICEDINRSLDIIGRMGGEEFMILYPDSGIQGALNAAERILQSVSNKHLELDDGRTLTVTVSIGVVERQNSETMEAMMQRADQAMYAAKNRGRNLVCTVEDCVICSDESPQAR
jgi:diguanylate cyclase (GGDEF)-like protein